jgi:hypothetical protein
MMSSLRIAFEHKECVTDLKPVVLRNETDIEFVMSDNPLVLANRYYFQRLNANNFGLANSGAILAMPLNPRLCAVWYDRGVYSIPNATGTPFVEVKKAHDATAVNEWQYLSAQDNLYFARWDDRTHVQAQAQSAIARRSEAGPTTTILVRDPKAPGESYRRGTAEEEAAAKETLVMASKANPKPSAWPAQIKFRPKPQVYSNGSALGYVRAAEWLRRAGGPAI